MDATTLQTIIDALFNLLENATASKPRLHALLDLLHTLAVSLIPTILKLLPQALPHDLQATLSAVLDAIFSALSTATLGNFWLHLAVGALQAIAKALLPVLVSVLSDKAILPKKN